MAALASPSELGALLNTSIDEDDARAVLVIRLVSGAVCQVAGSASDDWTAETVPDAVLGVVLAASARAWLNPSGMSQTSSGPFSGQWDDTALLTGAEREIVTGAIPNNVPGLSSVRVQAPARAAGSRNVYDWFDQVEESDEP